jgi:site-specific recombinase
VVNALHPWHSGTIFYAALTGVLLWLSSLVAGWLENWAVYRRIPEALAYHRGLRRILGDSGAKKLADVFSNHIAGLGGNVSIGVLLALPPIVGAFFGLPLDVRHVTLSFGQLCLAGYALGPDAVLRPDFLAALGGIGITLAINFGVSFSLALGVALRARDVPLAEVLRLVRLMTARFLREPRLFLLPPRA